MADLNEYYAGVMAEKDFGRYGCPNVFQYQHERLLGAYAGFSMLPGKIEATAVGTALTVTEV